MGYDGFMDAHGEHSKFQGHWADKGERQLRGLNDWFVAVCKAHRPLFDIGIPVVLTLVTWAQLFAAQLASRVMLHINTDGLEIATGFHQRSVIVSALLVAACFVPLVWRRRAPIATLAAVTAAQCATSLWTHDPLLTFIAPLIALYSVGRRERTEGLVVCTIAVVCVLVGVNQFAPMVKPRVILSQSQISPSPERGTDGTGKGEPGVTPGVTPEATPGVPPDAAFEPRNSSDGRDGAGAWTGGQGEGEPPGSGLALEFINRSRGRTFVSMLQIVACVVAVAALGRMTRLHQEYIVAAAHEAEEREHAREAEIARRAEEERLSIARELHDITAHSLAAIAVQAGAAEAVVGSDEEAARRAVTGIRATAKRSLDELRQVVGVLRSGNAAENAPLNPQASLRNVQELIADFAHNGLPVSLTVHEDEHGLETLPLAVDIAAYRIIEESLTNVLRHAHAPTTVSVTLTATMAVLDIEVRNDGLKPLPEQEKHSGHKDTAHTTTAHDAAHDTTAAHTTAAHENKGTTPTSGHGLEGMSERAHALGGNCEAAIDETSSEYVVRAVLPL
jgi:signal transduction histidine kinase